MRNINHHRRRPFTGPIAALLVTLLFLPFAVSRPAFAAFVVDIKAEEVIAKHLESIGDAAARADACSRVVVGTSHAVFRGASGDGVANGGVVLASANNKSLLGMKFDIPNYSGETMGFDGNKFTVGYNTPGKRSTLGSFLLIHGNIFKEGLVGGTLSTAWPLLNLAERGAKIQFEGTEKIGGVSVYVLRYNPRNSSDLSIKLYFDTKTYHHVRTQYERVIAAPISGGGIDAQAGRRETRYKFVEDFSDHKQEGKLNLPHTYTLQLEIQSTSNSVKNKWEMTLTQFAFNQEIDEKEFNVEGK